MISNSSCFFDTEDSIRYNKKKFSRRIEQPRPTQIKEKSDCVLGIKRNCIWWSDSTYGDHNNEKNPYFTITSRSTQTLLVFFYGSNRYV